ncbi:S1 family peptidase [Polymorphospora sp. NPDC050346]|uniref:S1 family peptidase n=1 Tax=Polymorphospora sp. NPDC050346 TaxID=3155780 RepID=UPI0033DB9AD2
MRRTLATAVALTVATGGLTTVLAIGGPASAAPTPAADVPAGMLAAMERDLGLTESQARQRIADEAVAAKTEQQLRKQLGAGFAGAWVDNSALVVAVTSERDAAAVRATGATAKVVDRSAADLDSTKSKLDAKSGAAGAAISGWHVDAKSNRVVLLADPGAATAAAEFIKAAGVDAATVDVVTVDESPRPLYDVVGGDAYYMGGRCSVGFSVVGGFVTAGHCGTVGTPTQGHNNVTQGTFQGSSFPGDDMGWVATNSSWNPAPLVNNYASGTVTVTGSAEASEGSAICRSGSTTGWHCGTLQVKNSTVNYPQGTVYGLTRTNVCAEPGDSGGSWLTGTEAQGVTSGGSGNCSFGGTTYYQPVNPILSTYGLSLVTG